MEKAFQHSHLMGGGGGGKMRGAAGLMGLQKQNSWSPDIERDEAWERRRRGLLRKDSSSSGLRRAQSVTDDDLDELRGCLDLGFGFEPAAAAGCAACGEGRSRLVETLPALDLYYAVAVKGGGGGAGGARGDMRQPVHVRRLVGGLRAVAYRESPLHTLPRRPAGDGEDEAEAVGAGGGAVPAQPFLNHSLHTDAVVPILHPEEEEGEKKKKTQKKRILPACLEKNQIGRRNEREKTQRILGIGDRPPSTFALVPS